MNKEEVKELFKRDWIIQGFLGSYKVIPFGSSAIKMKKYYDFDYGVVFYYFNGDYVEMYYPVNELKKIWFEIEKKYKENNNYFEELKEESEKLFSSYKEFRKEVDNTDLSKKELKELIGYYNKVDEMSYDSVVIAHICEAFSFCNETKLRHALKPLVKDVNKYFGILTQPVTSSWSGVAEKALHEISLKENKEELLKEHAKKYFWIRNNYYQSKPLTVDDFKVDLETLDFKEINYGEIKKKKKEIIEELNLDKEMQTLIHLIEFFVDWQDLRKQNVLLCRYYHGILEEEISKRLGHDKSYLDYLIPKEVNEEFLTKDIKKIATERKKGSLVVSLPEKDIVYYGKELEEFLPLMKHEHIEEHDLHGMPASGGTALGKAKICLSMDSLDKVEEGDILVTSMTRPEFLPAMKKASAIVTDEGGITCHAAILSREMKKPCVIGTKVATKVIKDGMLVEVKGNHGLVLIIKDE